MGRLSRLGVTWISSNASLEPSKPRVHLSQQFGAREIEAGADMTADRLCSMTKWLIAKEAAFSLAPLTLRPLLEDPLVVLGLYTLWKPVTLTGCVEVETSSTKRPFFLRVVGGSKPFKERGARQDCFICS